MKTDSLNYPKNIGELKVWAVEVAMRNVGKSLDAHKVKAIISVAMMLESYVNGDNTIGTEEEEPKPSKRGSKKKTATTEEPTPTAE